MATQAATSAFDRSVALSKALLEQRPTDPLLMTVLADVHFRWGRFKEAIVLYEQVLRVSKSMAEPLLAIAEAYGQIEDHERALEYYRKAVETGVEPVVLRANLGVADVYFKMNRHADAAAELRRLLRFSGNQPEIAYLYGRALEAQSRALPASTGTRTDSRGLDAEAARALEQAIQSDPANAQAHYILASIHRRNGSTELALRAMESFRRLRQSIPVVDYAVAARAEGVFEARTAVQLARALFTGGNAPAAEKLLEHALNIQPRFAEAMAYKAWICMRTQRSDEAVKLYDDILSAEPNHAEALWNLGKIHLSSGQVESSASLLLRATELKRAFPEGWELLAMLCREHGVYASRAEEFARNALRLRPSAANYLSLAMVFFRAQKITECREALSQGLQHHPGDADLSNALERLTR